jgi:hypothetical protein
MKYIKLFEDTKGHQFEKGNYVRLSYAKNKNLIFKVVDWRFSHEEQEYQYLLVNINNENFSLQYHSKSKDNWMPEKWLRKVPDYEADAIKYNM